MEEHDKQVSMRVIVMAIAIALVLAVFGKSVRAAGLLVAKDGGKSAIAIADHAVAVTITNGFAKTEVTQVFVNTSDRDLEAIYTFPLPERASLSELSLFVDEREIIGEVLEKAAARQVYEEQKAKGNDSAHAEKDGHKTFNVAVAPVRAGKPTTIRLVYYQPLQIDLGIGRYVYPLAEGGVDDERLAFWTVEDGVSGSFTFDLLLKSNVPIKEVRLPGHMDKAVIEHDGGEGAGPSLATATAKLHVKEGARLAEDVVFYYRLDDSLPARVELLPFKAQTSDSGTFMVTITPGVSLARIAEGVDWVFVLDVSGSMNGAKLKTLSDGIARVIGRMTGGDRFRIVTFNNEARDLTGGFLPATPENIARALTLVGQLSAEGSTNLHAGLAAGLRKTEDERTTSLVLVSDGVANVGPTAHRDFLELIGDRDVRLFTFLMGNSGNRPLLEDLAKASGGFAMDVSPSDDIVGRILQAKSKLLFENLHDAQVTINGGGVTELVPAKLGSLYQGQQAVVFGRYNRPGPVEVVLKAKISGEDKVWRCRAELPATDQESPEIERLWALAAIEETMTEIRRDGESAPLRQKVVDLGTAYSLVSDYTSMVVVEAGERERLGIGNSNAQRVERERQAQQQRAAQPARETRVDNAPDNQMFAGAKAPGVGSGAIDPATLLLLAAAALLLRRRHGATATDTSPSDAGQYRQ